MPECLMPLEDAVSNDKLLAEGKRNIGILCGEFSNVIAVDIDTDDPAIYNEVIDILGAASAAKIGRRGITLFYKYNGECYKRIKIPNTETYIEILSNNRGSRKGRNCVVPPSIHPDTQQPYKWVSPLVAADLTTITKEQWDVFAGRFGASPLSPDTYPSRSPIAAMSAVTSGIATVYETGSYQDNDEVYNLIKYCLEYIDAACDYNEWINIGFSINHAITGHKGQDLFTEWSMSSRRWDEDPEGNANKAAELFNNTNPIQGFQRTVCSLFAKARSNPLFNVSPYQDQLITSITLRTHGARVDIGDLDETASFTYIEKGVDDVDIAEALIRYYGRDNLHVATDDKTAYLYDSAERRWRAVASNAIRSNVKYFDQYAYKIVMDAMMRTPLFMQLATVQGVFSIDRFNKLRSKYLSAAYILKFNSFFSGYLVDRADIRRTAVIPVDTVYRGIVSADNAIVDFDTGMLRHITKDDYVFRSAPVKYVDDAACPFWESYLAEVFANNQDPQAMIAFMQRLFGYCLTDDVSQQKIFVFWGEGANGKSTIIDVLHKLLGGYASGFSRRISSESFVGKKNSPTRLSEKTSADCLGMRAVFVGDIPSGMVWNEGMIKDITDTTINARKLYQEPKEIRNTAKIIVACNNLPAIPDGNHGIWRRIVIIPFLRRFDSPGKVNHSVRITANIERELPGIFNWAVQGAIDYYQDNRLLEIPAEANAHAESYKVSSDPTEYFVRQVCQPPSSGTIPVTLADIMTAIDHYAAQVRGNDLLGSSIKIPSYSANILGRLLKRIGIQKVSKYNQYGEKVCLYLTDLLRLENREQIAVHRQKAAEIFLD